MHVLSWQMAYITKKLSINNNYWQKKKNDCLVLIETILKCLWKYEYEKDIMKVINNIETNGIVSVFLMD